MDQERFDQITRSLGTSPLRSYPVIPSRSGSRWLVTTHVGEKVPVYDEASHLIHHLNPTSHLI